jgi:hypothetical protein
MIAGALAARDTVLFLGVLITGNTPFIRSDGCAA